MGTFVVLISMIEVIVGANIYFFSSKGVALRQDTCTGTDTKIAVNSRFAPDRWKEAKSKKILRAETDAGGAIVVGQLLALSRLLGSRLHRCTCKGAEEPREKERARPQC
jgi:hypothetical protein